MTEIKFFKYAAGILLLLNILALSFFIFSKPDKFDEPKDGLKNHAALTLDLDEMQSAQFHDLVVEHQELMESLNEIQRQKLELLFENITKDKSDKEHAEQLKELGAIEMEKVESTFQHFVSIKSKLRPEQLDDFDQFMKAALRQILGQTGRQPQGPPPPPRRKHNNT